MGLTPAGIGGGGIRRRLLGDAALAEGLAAEVVPGRLAALSAAEGPGLPEVVEPLGGGLLGVDIRAVLAGPLAVAVLEGLAAAVRAGPSAEVDAPAVLAGDAETIANRERGRNYGV